MGKKDKKKVKKSV